MKINAKQYALSLFETLRDAKKSEVDGIITNFASLLVKNNQVSEIRRIEEYFTGLWNSHHGIVEAEIKTAHPLNKKNLKSLKDYIMSVTSAEEVDITETVDEDLLGGAVIKYGGRMVDASFRNKLQEIGRVLKN